MKKVVAYIKESYDELVHKVSWPTYSELTNSAVVVLYASLLIALVVFAMDFCFQNLWKNNLSTLKKEELRCLRLKEWYVLRAISGKEAKVKEYLEADIKNSDLGEYVSQVLIPTEKVYQVRNGKKIVKERSYLPGYVLVEAALVGEVSHHLRNTPNVIGFLGGSDKPVPLRQSEVNRILGTVDELQETGEDLNVPYIVGETVKVTFGPFSGFSGIIEEVNSEKKKLKVMVKIFGRKTPLELGFMQVEKE
ncbi:transcription termination/antitermination protein NusG [Bacteroides fragilis]|nr:transcription termination/antitermination protein NusG [Bacteroides fragilis]